MDNFFPNGKKIIYLTLQKTLIYLKNKWLLKMYYVGQVTEIDTPERSKLHKLIIMIKLTVMVTTVENDQKFMCHVEEEERREEGMQINILMQYMLFLPPDSTRQKKGTQEEVSTFSRKKNRNSMGRYHFIHFHILIFYGPMLTSL